MCSTVARWGCAALPTLCSHLNKLFTGPCISATDGKPLLSSHASTGAARQPRQVATSVCGTIRVHSCGSQNPPVKSYACWIVALTDANIRDLADRASSILISHAAHGLATSALDGMGEITLRDCLVVAAASSGSSLKQAWILEREVIPSGWSDAPVDLFIRRKGNQGALKDVGGVELKWWRRGDKSNAGNRRRDLARDFIRAAALYQHMESSAFVALLSTEVSWEKTTQTDKGDQPAMDLLCAKDAQKWNLISLQKSPAIKGAIRSVGNRVPITNIFHTKLISSLDLHLSSDRVASARVWSVVKPQRSKIMTAAEIKQFLRPSSEPQLPGDDQAKEA
jgi:hypothetical protein